MDGLITTQETLQEKTDQELVELAKENADFFGILMERYQGKLFWYIKHLSYFEKEDIEDMLQEVFVKVYRNINDYDPSLKFSSWIYRIARNHMIDQIRKKHARPQTLSLEGTDLVHMLKQSGSIERDVIQKDCLDKVKSAINELPLKYKEVLILRFLEGKDYEEIMDILRKPKGTVATLINRGKKILQEKIKEFKLDCF